MEHKRIIFEVDIPAVERPVEQALGDFRRALNIPGGAHPPEFGGELERIVHVLQNMRADRVRKRAITKGR